MNRYSGAVKCFVASCALSIFPLASFAQKYVQTNLVSDIPQVPNADGTSVTIDAHLKNVWGMSRGAASPWWVSNSGTGTSTLYSGAGVITQLVVTVPNAMGVNAPSRPASPLTSRAAQIRQEFEVISIEWLRHAASRERLNLGGFQTAATPAFLTVPHPVILGA